MNNYCTNCGKKLKHNELVCKNCQTPIVDLPYDYEYKSPQKAKLLKVILIIIVIFLLCILSIFIAKTLIQKNKVNSLQNNYVEPYLQQNYPNTNYSIEFDYSGKCIISGNCYFDPVQGCDGGACQEYEYLSDEDCQSYYYNVSTAKTNFVVTVVYKDNTYYVVEGRNIYGEDEKESSENE